MTDLQDTFMDAEQVCELIPKMTKQQLAQLRYTGRGPKFYKPTPKIVLYKANEVLEWIERSGRSITNE